MKFICLLLVFSLHAFAEDAGDDGFGDDWGDDPKQGIPLTPPGAPPGTTFPNNQPPQNTQNNPPPSFEASTSSNKSSGEKVVFHLTGIQRVNPVRKNWRENVFGKTWKTPDP